MKALIALGCAAVLAGTTLHAQSHPDPAVAARSPIASVSSYQECDLQKLEHRLLISLNHDYEGVVVGALREVAKIKLGQPSCESEVLSRRIDELVEEGATPAIRYKAYLTSVVLSNPAPFSVEGETAFQSDEQFFVALARRLELIALRDER